MTILEGGTQDHVHYKWKEDLIEMLEELGQSYRVLVISYNQLKSKASSRTCLSGSSSSSGTLKTRSAICNKTATGNLEDEILKQGCNRYPKSRKEHSNGKFNGIDMHFELLNKQDDEYHELSSAGSCSMKFKSKHERRDSQMEEVITNFSTEENILMNLEDLELNEKNEDPSMINFKFDSKWTMLKYQITKLTEDNLHQLVELVQRNDEKRETIKRLQLEVEALKRENKVLQTSLRNSNAYSERSQPQISTPRRMSMAKIFEGWSP